MNVYEVKKFKKLNLLHFVQTYYITIQKARGRQNISKTLNLVGAVNEDDEHNKLVKVYLSNSPQQCSHTFVQRHQFLPVNQIVTAGCNYQSYTIFICTY